MEAWVTLEARLVASDEAEELVASRKYSTTSQVCRVASGAKETRRRAVHGSVIYIYMATEQNLPSDLRRASRLFFSSSSLDARMDLTAGMNADLRRLPVDSFSAGASSSPRPPGPMLLLRVLRAVFFGDSAGKGALRDMLARRPSAMFSLPSAMAAVCCAGVDGAGVGGVVLLGTGGPSR